VQIRSAQELEVALDGIPVVNVCEANPMRNVGDHWSAVGRNVGWVDELGTLVSLPEALSLHRPGERSPLQGKLVIIGGSGLVGPGPFEQAVQSIFPQRPAGVVFWGIGHNVLYGVHRDPTTGWNNRVLMDGRTLLWPEYFSRARLVGVRDYGAGMPWVPCASALLPGIDTAREIVPEHDFAVVNHYEHPIDTSIATERGLHFPHITNNTEDVDAVLRTLASARVVVSNSYHVLYWSLLLGRGVVAYEPFNTRFDHFRWPIQRASATDWLDAAERAMPSPNALTEARTATYGYSAQVFGLARSLGLVPTVTQVDTRRPAVPASDSVVVAMERAS
jgi:hypothetical protein